MVARSNRFAPPTAQNGYRDIIAPRGSRGYFHFMDIDLA